MGDGKRCPKCDALNVPGAIICSLCAESLIGGADPGASAEGRTTARPSGGARPAAVKGGMAGFGMGWLIAGVMFCVGLVLTLSGIGAIVGIPLIIGSFAAPFVVGGFWAAVRRREAAQHVRGPCPYCSEDLIATGMVFDCPACGQRVIHRGGHFMTLERAKHDTPLSGTGSPR